MMSGILSRSSNKALPGGGNRGPLPPEASGGGGGGGGRGDGDGLHGFHQQLQRYRLGLLFTIASIVMLFISFTTLFVARRDAGRYDPITGVFNTDWVSVPLPTKILLINTAALLLSSMLVELARRGARMESILVPMSSIPGVRPVRQTSPLWVVATLLAGCAFLFGQACAWRQLRFAGAVLNGGPASTFVYLLTGTHALHLMAGLAVLLYALIAKGPRLSLERRSITLDVTAWYWHFMTVMWLYVLLVLRLMN
jgi:cytochrome c oxidase subunit 3